MRDFHFASKAYLALLPALLLLGLLLARVRSRARERLLRFVAESNLATLLKGGSAGSRKSARIAFWLGAALCVLALARPRANPSVEESRSAGLDIYVLLDVSRSMDAEDVAPSRLKKAKKSVQHLASRLSGDRVGIIAFANSSVLLCPLTNDYSILESYLQTVDTGFIPSQGTSIGNALETALDAMNRGSANPGDPESHTNVFLVLSDGEDHGESDLGVVKRIRASGGLIFSIAFGSEKGAPIPLRDDRGELRGYKKDAAGNVIVSAVKTAVLKEIAENGGGTFYFSTVDEAEIADLLARIADAQRKSHAMVKTIVYEELYLHLLWPGGLLLLLSFLTLGVFREAKLRPPAANSLLGRLRARFFALGFLSLLELAPVHSEAGWLSMFHDKDRQASDRAQDLAKDSKLDEAIEALKPLQAENPDHEGVSFNLGTYLLQSKKGAEGREQLLRLRNSEGKVRDRAWFNSAGSLAEEGKKEEARAVYAELIARLSRKEKRSPDEEEILALARRNVERLADPNQSPPPPQNSDKQKQDQDRKEEKKDEEKKEQKDGGTPDSKKDSPDGKGSEQKQDSKQEQKQDGKQGGQGDDKKQSDGSDSKQDQKAPENPQDQTGKDSKGRQDAKGAPPPGNPGRPQFRERDNMGEDEAKRILGALKERESSLQKRFLKNKIKGGRVKTDDAGKDW